VPGLAPCSRMSGTPPPIRRWHRSAGASTKRGRAATAGIEIACRAAHQASLADDSGAFIWTGRRFRTSPEELERLWAMLPDQAELVGVTVIMEPTRNAWVPLAAWVRRRGATVVLGPTRAGRRPACLLPQAHQDRPARLAPAARLPLLHPDGLHAEHGLGPGDVLRRATKLRATLVKRRSATSAAWTRCRSCSGRAG
jgi:hypothetical protein